MTVRVRYAPSPTGRLHIGGVRTALFNYLFARHHGGEFILRSEDTDLDRNVPGAEAEILDGFRWLGFEWTEGPDVGGPHAPYRCTERLDIYPVYLNQLIEAESAYPCFCTSEELEADRAQAQESGEMPRYSGHCRTLTEAERQAQRDAGRVPNWRFAVPPGVSIEFDDLVRGPIAFHSDDVGDFVIVKSNGIPTYNFQVVVDDALMEITHVIRGEEHLSNTPRQWLIYRALGVEAPVFAHLPQVLDSTRKKLSKRDPSVMPVQAYRDQGYLPAAIVNFLALLGWSPGGEQELFSLSELADLFDLDRVHRSGAIFDTDKLRWMAGQYLHQLPVDELARMIEGQWSTQTVARPDWLDTSTLHTLVTLYQEQMACAADFFTLARGFWQRDVEWADEIWPVLQEDGAVEVVRKYRELAAQDTDWTADASRSRFRQVQSELGVKGRALFMPVRAAVTGTAHGPDLQQSIACLPREWVLRRMDEVLARLAALR